MAFGDILARVLSLAGFVLTLIVVFAGSQCGGALEDVYVILLDVSAIKTNPSPDPDGNVLAIDLGLYEFFTIHVLTYCAGFYNDDGSRNTTMCTSPTVPFAFNLTTALLTSLAAGGSGPDDIDWPYAVISDFTWVSSTSKTVSVLVILIIIIMGVGTLIDGLIFSGNPLLYPYISRSFTLVSLVIMIITAAISTFIATGFVTLLNLTGALYDISATGGVVFLVLTWLAVALCLLRNLPFLINLRICLATDEAIKSADTAEAIRLLENAA